MTRANINYMFQDEGKMPQVLYHYHNGDQYPRGMRDFYKVLDFINSDWSKKAFRKWLGENYTTVQRVKATGNNGISIEYDKRTEVPAKPKLQEHKIVDDYTDWAYVFINLFGSKKVQVYNWGKLEFEGNDKEFTKWIKAQK